jgi:hypothetical protein
LKKINENKNEIAKHELYFETVAKTISILAENINMQMEAEYADLLDRKLMALYGLQKGNPNKVDHGTNLDSNSRNKY